MRPSEVVVVYGAIQNLDSEVTSINEHRRVFMSLFYDILLQLYRPVCLLYCIVSLLMRREASSTNNMKSSVKRLSSFNKYNINIMSVFIIIRVFV